MSTKSVQWRRGTTSDHDSFTGLQGEITVDVTKNTLIVHDQANVGGFPLAREDLSNVSSADLSSKGLALNDLSNVDPALFLPNDASDTTKGLVELATNAETITGTDTTRVTTPANVKAALDSLNIDTSLPKRYLSGLIPTLAADTDHDITISIGETRSSDNTTDISLSGALTKQVDSSWVTGNDVGGLASPLTVTADTTYHLFVIYNPTTQTTDAGFDTDLNATNLLNAATGYTKYRRIGSFLTDSSANLIPFTTDETAGGGMIIQYHTDQVDITALTTSYASYGLSIPNGIKIRPLIYCKYWSNIDPMPSIIARIGTLEKHIASGSGNMNGGAGIPYTTLTLSTNILEFKKTNDAVIQSDVLTQGYIDERL